MAGRSSMSRTLVPPAHRALSQVQHRCLGPLPDRAEEIDTNTQEEEEILSAREEFEIENSRNTPVKPRYLVPLSDAVEYQSPLHQRLARHREIYIAQ